MKLVVEQADAAGLGLAPGVYDVPAGTVHAAIGGSMKIETSLPTSAKPAPLRRVHVFQMVHDRDHLHAADRITAQINTYDAVLAGPSLSELENVRTVPDVQLHRAVDPAMMLAQEAERCCQAVVMDLARHVVQASVPAPIANKMKAQRPGAASMPQTLLDGAKAGGKCPAVKSPTCDECKGTGEYVCPVTAKRSPCSAGCRP